MATLSALGGVDGRSAVQASTGACAGDAGTHESVSRLAGAVLCLHNAERRRHGLGSLRWNRELSLAASRYARDMVDRHYFDHRSPEGTNYMRRAAAAGYGRGTADWGAGENLLLWRSPLTAGQMLNAWMASTEHRRNILRTRWEEFGLGVVLTSPFGDVDGVTVVALFGRRFDRAHR